MRGRASQRVSVSRCGRLLSKQRWIRLERGTCSPPAALRIRHRGSLRRIFSSDHRGLSTRRRVSVARAGRRICSQRRQRLGCCQTERDLRGSVRTRLDELGASLISRRTLMSHAGGEQAWSPVSFWTARLLSSSFSSSSSHDPTMTRRSAAAQSFLDILTPLHPSTSAASLRARLDALRKVTLPLTPPYGSLIHTVARTTRRHSLGPVRSSSHPPLDLETSPASAPRPPFLLLLLLRPSPPPLRRDVQGSDDSRAESRVQ